MFETTDVRAAKAVTSQFFSSSSCRSGDSDACMVFDSTSYDCARGSWDMGKEGLDLPGEVTLLPLGKMSALDRN